MSVLASACIGPGGGDCDCPELEEAVRESDWLGREARILDVRSSEFADEKEVTLYLVPDDDADHGDLIARLDDLERRFRAAGIDTHRSTEQGLRAGGRLYHEPGVALVAREVTPVDAVDYPVPDGDPHVIVSAFAVGSDAEARAALEPFLTVIDGT